MLEAVIFDMDGVLVDSEYTFLESKTEILKDAGFPKDISYQYQFMGTTFDYMWQTMKNELGLPLSVDDYIHDMEERRRVMIDRDGRKEITGSPQLVRRLYDAGIPLAVASSSPKYEILEAMDSLGIKDCFQALVSGEEVEHSKPEPDVFLKAAEELGKTPKNCLVFEDTRNGSLAAQRAGMYVVGFSNPDYPAQDLSAANRIVTSYQDITANDLKKLMEY